MSKYKQTQIVLSEMIEISVYHQKQSVYASEMNRSVRRTVGHFIENGASQWVRSLAHTQNMYYNNSPAAAAS